MIACEHCNDQNICLFYNYNYYRRCQIFILKKPRFDKIFQIKPRHPDGLKKTQIWVEKHSNVWPGADVASGSTPIFYGVAGYFCSYCINCSVAALRVVFCSGLLT